MKRILAGILILSIALSLCACSTKPEGVSDTAYKLGQKAVEVADDYLNIKITKTEACDRLEEIVERINAADSDEYDSIVKMKVTTLNLVLTWAGSTLGDTKDSDVIDSRNDLASYLGLKERK